MSPVCQPMKPKSTRMSPRARIRILVADDHPVVREGIIASLKPQRDMTVVAEAKDGLEAITLIKEHLPDIVLLDLRMPLLDGLEVVAEVKTLKLAAKVIILTVFESEHDIHRAVKAGARGYLLKDTSPEEILEAIRRVSAGATYLPARIAQKLAEGTRKPELSPRELEVLQAVAAGKNDRDTAAQLSITESTVKTHVRSLLEKLGVAGRTAAVMEAVRRGLAKFN